MFAWLILVAFLCGSVEDVRFKAIALFWIFSRGPRAKWHRIRSLFMREIICIAQPQSRLSYFFGKLQQARLEACLRWNLVLRSSTFIDRHFLWT
jgi:hypothetical protein